MMFFELFVAIIEMLLSLPFIHFLIVFGILNYFLVQHFPIVMDFRHFENLSNWTQNDYIIVGINLAVALLFFLLMGGKKKKQKPIYYRHY